jgi:pilus assembly protein CpaB
MGRVADRLRPTSQRAPEAAARGSGVRAAFFLVMAAVAAVGAGVLFTRHLERSSKTVETRRVVVAAVDLPVATTLRSEVLTTVQWPAAHVPANSFEDPEALAGKVVRVGILKGEAVLGPRLVSGEAGHGLAAILPPEMRAVSVRVDDVVGVAGFIHPGDSVDVIVTMKPFESGDAPSTSKVILQNIKVLAVGKEIDRKDKKLDKAVPVTVATLMVNSEDSERLALASARGKILLALRSGADVEEVETPGIVPAVLLEGTPALVARAEREARAQAQPKQARPVARPRPAPARPAAAPAPQQEVEILRGDLFEKRHFTNQEPKP